jgi:hypothetical protein
MRRLLGCPDASTSRVRFDASLGSPDAGNLNLLRSICFEPDSLSTSHRALLHDVRRRASSRPCQMAKAARARIVIVIAMIFSLLFDASCSGKGSFIVLSSKSWVARESGSRHSNHEVAGCPSSANEEDSLHLTQCTPDLSRFKSGLLREHNQSVNFCKWYVNRAVPVGQMVSRIA